MDGVDDADARWHSAHVFTEKEAERRGNRPLKEEPVERNEPISNELLCGHFQSQAQYQELGTVPFTCPNSPVNT